MESEIKETIKFLIEESSYNQEEIINAVCKKFSVNIIDAKRIFKENFQKMNG